MRSKFRYLLLTPSLLLAHPSLNLAQGDQQPRVLVIDGHAGQAAVIQKDGRAYVDLQSLVEIANASLSFKANQIVLRMRASDSNAPAAEGLGDAAHSPADNSALSREFMRAGIEEFATMREWASTMANAVQNGYQVTEDWAANYREQAANNLRLASAATSTEADRNAFQLLSNEFEAVRDWSNRLIQERKSMDTAKYALSPNALRDD